MNPNRKISVLCDVDGVLADFIGHICNEIDGNITPESFKSFALEPHLTASQLEQVHDLCEQPGFCGSIPAYQGVETLFQAFTNLAEWCQVYAVTAPWETSETWCFERTWWLKNRGIEAHHVIYASTSAKPLIRGHVLIEDNGETLVRWLNSNPGEGILVDRPWNRDPFYDEHKRIIRVDDYEDLATCLANIVGSMVL
jgi:5'(3')-deoxyribonucleotidase